MLVIGSPRNISRDQSDRGQATSPPSLEELADDLSQFLGIPFRPEGDFLCFPRPLRLTDWSVPMIFDGHVARRDDELVPVDFVGHVLWAHLDAWQPEGESRSWWSCRFTPWAAVAILEHLAAAVADEAQSEDGDSDSEEDSVQADSA
jgi:hypothetical protein